jgi:hypothetical protein
MLLMVVSRVSCSMSHAAPLCGAVAADVTPELPRYLSAACDDDFGFDI